MKVKTTEMQAQRNVLVLMNLAVLSLILIVGTFLLARDFNRSTATEYSPDSFKEMLAEGDEVGHLALLLDALESECPMILLLPREGLFALAPGCKANSQPDGMELRFSTLVYPVIPDIQQRSDDIKTLSILGDYGLERDSLKKI